MNIDFKHNWQEEGSLQHWCPKSQALAPAHVLSQYIRIGWKIRNAVKVVQYHLTGDRHVNVYHFKLHHWDEHLEMPVLANPVVLNIVREQALTVTNTVARYDQVKREHETALSALSVS